MGVRIVVVRREVTSLACHLGLEEWVAPSALLAQRSSPSAFQISSRYAAPVVSQLNRDPGALEARRPIDAHGRLAYALCAL